MIKQITKKFNHRRNSTIYSFIKSISLIFIIFLSVSTGGLVAAEEELTLRLKWFHQFQFAGYYAAQEKGFYQDEGLKVKILARDPALSPVQEVVDGKIDFAVSDSSLILSRLNGEPVVALAAIMQSSPLVLMSLAEHEITSPLELIGKRIMYQKEVDDALIMAMLNEFNISDKSFEFVPHNFDDKALLNDHTDVMSAYITNQPFIYRELGRQVNIINPANYGIEFYGDNLFTSERMLDKESEKVLAFRRASIKGWRYALENSEEVIDWIINIYASKKSRAALAYEAKMTQRMIKPKLIEIGNINPSRFRRIAEIYKEKGLAPLSSDLSGLHYLEYTQTPDQLKFTIYVISIVLAILLIVLLIVIYLNKRLKQSVQARTESLADANQRLKKLMGFVAHDLRNPLGAILSFAKMGQNPKFRDKLPQVLESMEGSAAKGLELVKSALEATALGTGKYELDLSRFDFSELAKQSVQNFKEIAQAKGLKFNIDIALGTWVKADFNRMTQVLDNIVLNAIKYSSENSEININCEPKGSQVKFCCINQIPEDSCVEDEEENLYRSFGFGIEIIREILELHHAKLEFKSHNWQLV
jgi:ABC-type nitrate/sulfonate/bicarbonate transport system substrate-binding protein